MRIFDMRGPLLNDWLSKAPISALAHEAEILELVTTETQRSDMLQHGTVLAMIMLDHILYMIHKRNCSSCHENSFYILTCNPEPQSCTNVCQFPTDVYVQDPRKWFLCCGTNPLLILNPLWAIFKEWKITSFMVLFHSWVFLTINTKNHFPVKKLKQWFFLIIKDVLCVVWQVIS